MRSMIRRFIRSPSLSERDISSLFRGRKMDSPSPAGEGDCFFLRHGREDFAVLCYSSTDGRCRMRRMNGDEVKRNLAAYPTVLESLLCKGEDMEGGD